MLLAAAILSGCVGLTVNRFDPCVAQADVPPLASSGDRQTTEISVLIYNVEGLPWPARAGRSAPLRKIGVELARQRSTGTAPDIVMVQEAFTRRAADIAQRAGYRNIVSGPSRSAARSMPGAELPDEFVGARRLKKGERVGKLLNGGLQIASKFPIVASFREPFSRHACAGFDCLANKGVLLARIWIPGVPTPVDFFTTHMNAQRAARVKLARAHEAHRHQVDESAKFLEAVRGERHPLIFGGDFNMRRAPNRLDHFTYRKPYHIVRHYCTVSSRDCDVRMSWDGDEPWLDTQDLQGFDDGTVVSVRPIRVEAAFDGPQTGGKLSDHDGYKVTYRLSWRSRTPGESAPPLCLPDRPAAGEGQAPREG